MSNQTKKLNTYTSEFKESAVKLALESDQPIAQTARELGVNPNTIHKTAVERTDEPIMTKTNALRGSLLE